MANRIKLTDARRKKFLDVLGDTCNVTKAATAAGIARGYAYEFKKENPDFAAQWDEVLEKALDDLEEVAFKRAREGSDSVLLAALRSHRRETWGERTEISGPGGGAIQTESKIDFEKMTREQIEAIAQIPVRT